MTPPAEATWRGCHGVRVKGSAENALGHVAGTPIATVDVVLGPSSTDAAGTEVWRRSATATIRDRHLVVDQCLAQRPSGALVLRTTAGSVEYEPNGSRITVDAVDDAVAGQLLVGFGLPLALHDHDALVVHASACARDGRAVLVCGPSGRGKSSALVALTDAGWDAVSEDLCAIDLRDERPRVWPGPPWVRRAHGEPGPRGSRARFSTAEKTAWDLEGRLTRRPVPVDRIVFLDPPAGDAPVVQSLGRADAIRELAPHAVWLGDGESGATRLFSAVVRVTAGVDAARLQLPRTSSWHEHVARVLM